MLTTSQGIHVVRLRRLAITKGWNYHFQSLFSVLLSWNWTVSDISHSTRTCCGMRKSRLLVFKWSERAHVSSAGLRPVLSDWSCRFCLLQLNYASWNTCNIISCFFTKSVDVWQRLTRLPMWRFLIVFHKEIMCFMSHMVKY